MDCVGIFLLVLLLPSFSLFTSVKILLLIDVCINNGIIGVQEGNAYAETKGKR
jgi:hypothetical protein